MSNSNLHAGFAQFLNEATSKAAAEHENIVDIDIDNLIPNPNNRYGLRDIDSLASYMTVNGLHVETLEVSPIAGEEGKYRIVAGHRRQAAWRKLLEEGVTDKRTLPCIIRDFQDVHFTVENTDGSETDETFNADQMEEFSLILSNLGQRKEKTLEEQVWEVKTLEPYARAIYRSKHQNKEFKGTFREFFAKEILEISPAMLYRKQSLERLSDKAKKALFEDHIIGESVATMLVKYSPKEQDIFIDGVRSGEISGSIEDIRRTFEPKKQETEEDDADDGIAISMDGDEAEDTDEGEDEDEPMDIPQGLPGDTDYGEPMTPADPNSYNGVPPLPQPDIEGIRDGESNPPTTQEEEDEAASSPQANGFVIETIPVPEEFDDPQREANAWFDQAQIQACQMLIKDAEKHQMESEAKNDQIGAAQWGIRLSVAKYRLVKMQTK